MATRRKSTRARRKRSRPAQKFYCVSKKENVTVPDESICIGSFELRNHRGTRYYKSSVCPDTQQKLVEFTSEVKHNEMKDKGYPKCKRKFKRRKSKSKSKSRRRKSKSKSSRRKSKSKSRSHRRKSKNKSRRKSRSKNKSRRSKSKSKSRRRKSKSRRRKSKSRSRK